MKSKKIYLIIALTLALSIIFSATMPIFAVSTSYVYYCNKLTPNYTTTNLNALTNGTYNWYNELYSYGCVMTSYAMLLRNLGKTTATKQIDIRTTSTTSQNLAADPFTVTFANTNFASITKSGSNYISSYTGSPVSANHTTIASNFGVTYHSVDLSTGHTELDKANNVAYRLAQNPTSGVVIFLSGTNGTHAVVVTATTHSYPSTWSLSAPTYAMAYSNDTLSAPAPELDKNDPRYDIPAIGMYNNEYSISPITAVAATTYGSKFTICDPVNEAQRPGNQKLFDDTWTGSKFSWNDIQYIRWFD